jgi:predicted phage terminase large subunit-like protein
MVNHICEPIIGTGTADDLTADEAWMLGFMFGDGGAKNKRVPTQIYRQAAHLREAFLSGFAAADGYLHETGGYSVQNINLANRLLIDDLRHLARTVAGTTPFVLSKVKSITPCGRAEVFDISVDGEENFLADGLVAHNTRWHVDDILGRYIQRFPDVRVLRYPAIAEHDELHRRKGEALFPEHKPLDFLLERKRLLTQPSWESIYQQHPIIVGGGQLPIEKLKVLPVFDRSKVTHTIRYWDKAGTDAADNEDAAYTAGARVHSMIDGTYVISHMVRGQWAALERETKIKTWAEADEAMFPGHEIYCEQEPGSGGKESAESTIRNLAGFRVYADKVTGHKEVRAEPFCAQVQGGNVYLVAGEWISDFLDECEVWPAAKWKDQVDAASGAFNKIATNTAYLPLEKWL